MTQRYENDKGVMNASLRQVYITRETGSLHSTAIKKR